MNKIQFGGALALSLLLVACGERQNAGHENRQAANDSATAARASDTYSASGKVTAIAGNKVTISHGPVEGIGWPAMIMTFEAASAEMISGVTVGDQVSFAFRQDGGAYTLTSLSKDR